MKLKCKRKSNKLIYCVKKESKFSKDISGEETSSKEVPTNAPRVFHAETRGTRRFYVVSTSCQIGTQAVYL